MQRYHGPTNILIMPVGYQNSFLLCFCFGTTIHWCCCKIVDSGHDTTACSAAQATGRKKTTAKEEKTKSDSEPVAQGLVLVGDVGFEKYKTASEYLKAKKQSNQGRFSEASVGFGNLSLIHI